MRSSRIQTSAGRSRGDSTSASGLVMHTILLGRPDRRVRATLSPVPPLRLPPLGHGRMTVGSGAGGVVGPRLIQRNACDLAAALDRRIHRCIRLVAPSKWPATLKHGNSELLEAAQDRRSMTPKGPGSRTATYPSRAVRSSCLPHRFARSGLSETWRQAIARRIHADAYCGV